MSELFDLSFYLAAPFWALMIILPTWSWTQKIIASPWITVPTLVVWAIVAVPVLGPLWSLVTSPNLPKLEHLLTQPGAVTLVWAQIIAWDLFIGRWMYLDGRRRELSPLLMSPLLIFTVLLSPVGLPLYLVVRTVRKPARPTTPAPAATGG